MKIIKNILPFQTKYYFRLLQQKNKPLSFFKDIKLDSNRNKAFIFLAADYGNLGDVAITYAQTKFIEENSNYQVIEIPISQSLEGLWWVKSIIKENDIVTTVGGGNMGEMYNQIEYIRQLVFRFFPNNKIISFPQTFDFSDSKEGEKALKIAQKVYGKHKNLTLIAREELSFKMMKQSFPNKNILLTPDIVMSLDMSQKEIERHGAVLCLRDDKEKALTQEQENFIVETTKHKYSDVSFYDTHINRNYLTLQERLEELNKIWGAFSKAEVVITDRLHGMIFCYITNTPCIVLQNNNHKIKETHKWIERSKHIRLVDKLSENYFNRLLDEKMKSNEYINIQELYNAIKNIL